MTLPAAETPSNWVQVEYTGTRIGSFSIFGIVTKRAYRFSSRSRIVLVDPSDVPSVLAFQNFRVVGGQYIAPAQVQVTGPSVQERAKPSKIENKPPIFAPGGTMPRVSPSMSTGATKQTTVTPTPVVPPGTPVDIASELQRTVEESDPDFKNKVRNTKRESKVEDRGTKKVRLGPGL